MAATASVYTAAVVGGGMGGRLSLRALTDSGRFRVVAACDLRPEICRDLERDFPGIRTFSDHRAMLRDCPVDVVCVATFPSSHREVVMDALELPLKGILVEKPLGHDAEAGRRDPCGDQGARSPHGGAARAPGQAGAARGDRAGPQGRHRRAQAHRDSVPRLGHHQCRHPLAQFLRHPHRLRTIRRSRCSRASTPARAPIATACRSRPSP